MEKESCWDNLYEIEIFEQNCPLKRIFLSSQSNLKNTGIIILLFSIFPAALFFTTSYMDGSISMPGERGLIQDYIFLSYFVFIPALFISAMLYFPRFPGVLNSIQEVIEKEENSNNLTPMSCEQFETLLKEQEKWIQASESKKLKIAFIIGGLAWVVLGAKSHWFAVDTYGMDIWSSQNNQISFYARTVYEFFVFGLLFPLTLYKYVAIITSMRNVCFKLNKDGSIRIRPLNPDKAGGLGRLGRYSFRLVVFLIPPILPILTYIYMGNVTLIFIAGVTLYLPLLVFTFFFPLSGAHGAMKEFKIQELKRLSREFNVIYDGFIDHITASDREKNEKIEKLASDSNLMEKLDELYQKAEKMPVWPFDTQTITKFMSLVGVTFLSIWLNWLFGHLMN